VVVLLCLLGLGLGPSAMAQSPAPSVPPPGPPFPARLDGVAVYDQAAVLTEDTVDWIETTVEGIADRSSVEVVVYTQVKPESDTTTAAEADAAALAEQWTIGRAMVQGGLIVLVDLTPDRCHGQVQIYADWSAEVGFLEVEQRQAIFERDMLPLLRDCDIDGAVRAAIAAIETASIDEDIRVGTTPPVVTATASPSSVPPASPTATGSSVQE
jgi:uncharacterized membrane protein YgcG